VHSPIIGGDDIPRRVICASGVEAILVGFHVVFPIFPLVDVRGAELPVLVRLFHALKESLSLFIVREVQEYLDDLRSVAMKVLLQIDNRVIPLLPDVLLVTQLLR